MLRGSHRLDAREGAAQTARHVHRPAAVAEVAAQLAEDRGDGERAQRLAEGRVEAAYSGHEADASDLHEIVARLARVRIAPREPAHERHEALQELLERV